MISKLPNFTKCLVALTSLACFLSSGDEWALVTLVVMYLVHETVKARYVEASTRRIESLENSVGDVLRLNADLPALKADISKLQDHVKNLQLTKLHRN